MSEERPGIRCCKEKDERDCSAVGRNTILRGEKMEAKKIKLRITALSDNCRRFAVVCLGVKVAVAFDRDSGARVAYGARMISGNIDSGGSRKNWYCRVDEGSIFEIEVDEEIYNKNKNRITKWKMEIIDEFSMTEERSKMLKYASDHLE